MLKTLSGINLHIRDKLMDRRLYRAAVKGSVPSLLQLLQEDELVLERSLLGPGLETPLHIAAMLGHTEFVDKVLSLKPELASELDSQRSTPLHLAAAKGYVAIVKSLLNACPEACLAADKYRRNPLQAAAVKGKVEVVEVLLQFNAEAARSVDGNGETVLHMCVKNNKLESLKAVVGMFGGEDEFIDWRNKDGNSALHLAAEDEQFETIDFLTTQTIADMNSPNLEGFTASDLLARSKSNAKEKTTWNPRQLNQAPTLENHGKSSDRRNKHPSGGSYNWRKHFRRQNSWQERMRTSLMVVATLTATMGFQAGMNPPSGVWQDNSGDSSTSTPVPVNNTIHFFRLSVPGNLNISHIAGISIMADTNYDMYLAFLVFNTIGFVASLSIILLLISGLPMRRRLFVWVLMVIMWIVITSMALTYAVSIVFLTPRDQKLSYEIIGLGILVWAGLMTLLVFLHTIRLIVRALRACWRAVTPRKRELIV